MEQILNHPWEISEKEAIVLQYSLAEKVIKQDEFTEVNYVAGVDVAYSKRSDSLIAAVVILDVNSLKPVESVVIEDKVRFPYVPGLFSFRELPPIVKAFKRIKIKPDLIVCDGQGIAHPRRFGLACHLGVLLDTPTIGCGKTRLIGTFVEPESQRGSYSPLIDNSEVIGKVLRTQNNVNPIFVSIGHRISLETSCNWILALSPKYRLPETTRQADHLVKTTLT
ncbi:deoxyribonuclease V [Paenibacillus taichungensis]|uniref:deoxyribonuclease V n=1 Tax=Paenibacillus sp. AD87 TaxID=1528787 RepID=UPI0007E2E45B|nr:deoxyribonuclease V [Paenibacillus sp. AD87]OAX47549.1 Endonuclease V [Paenibacillus sp. AD87]OAX51153.1 Endonuclease V [Paenibacillus sp. AD87]